MQSASCNSDLTNDASIKNEKYLDYWIVWPEKSSPNVFTGALKIAQYGHTCDQAILINSTKPYLT